jgi:hypothetical protein
MEDRRPDWLAGKVGFLRLLRSKPVSTYEVQQYFKSISSGTQLLGYFLKHQFELVLVLNMEDRRPDWLAGKVHTNVIQYYAVQYAPTWTF